MSNNEELKPCPFCGGEAHTFGHTKSWGVLCTKCYISTLRYETEAAAMAVWNKRTNSEKQNSLKELMDFVKFCRNASEGCIVYINNRARDLIAKHKECCKYAECKDGREINFPTITKLTYADIKKMVMPLKWKYISNLKAHYASTNKGMFFKIYKGNGDYILSIDGNNPVAFSEKLSKIKQAAQEFLVDLVAAALGVERSEQ